ncbi:MAG: NADH-quinone oxidoreductase subunit L [bacterium]
MIDYAWLTPLIPLAGTVINGIFGRRLPKFVAGPLACLTVLCSFALSLMVFLELNAMDEGRRLAVRSVFTWIESGTIKVDFAVLIDPLSAVMLLIVTGVGFLIHVYSLGYMGHDEGYTRYFSYLNLFMFSMLLLVSAGSFLLMFVGWELVGLCSYLLIGFWYEKKSAADAGKKAFVVNRVGDFGFLLGMLALFGVFGTLDFEKVFAAVRHDSLVSPWFADHAVPVHEALAVATPLLGLPLITVICLSLFLGATGKSAQIPLYVWLPDAMEGPTPVSALIHAATMVTAGVYMVARCGALFTASPDAMLVVAYVGALTAIFAASIGLAQNDIKRVLAYSTVSQLGYMFLACGVGAFAAGIFHLATHAFFKALLFMCAGSVMHAMSGELDMKKMGALAKTMKITAVTMWVGALTIAGIPPLSGFFSKDEILWSAYSAHLNGSETGKILYALGAAAAVMTAFYMFRLIFLTFHGKSRAAPGVHPHESPPSMTVPLVVLAALSVVAGCVGVPELLGRFPLSRWFFDFLAPVTGGGHGSAPAAHAGSGAEGAVMLVSVCAAAAGILAAYWVYNARPALHDRIRERLGPVHRLVFNKYYVDEIYTFLIVEPGKWLSSRLLWRVFDAGVIDGVVNGAGYLAQGAGAVLRRFQTGVVLNYALFFVLGIIVMLYLIL